MTDAEAKELLIGGMNYAAYKETGHSLWPSDKHTLFGESHYPVGPRDGQSVWGEGDAFEMRMAELLRWALRLGTTMGDYSEAIRHLIMGEHYLNRIIQRAGVAGV